MALETTKSKDENKRLFQEAEKLREKAKRDVKLMMSNDKKGTEVKRSGASFYNVRCS